MSDRPVTDQELDDFYGRPPTREEIDVEIGKQATVMQDMANLAVALFNYESNFLDAVASKDAAAIGAIVLHARACRIAELASMEIYGESSMIKPSEVKV
jgi:hypothetical protein